MEKRQVSDRDELAKLRRLKELETKAGPTKEQQAIAHPLNRFAMGVLDPVNAGAELLSKIPGADYVNRAVGAVNELPVLGTLTKGLGMTPATSGEISQRITEQERGYQDARTATGNTGIDFMRAGGNIAGTLPIALSFGAPATMGKLAAQGAALGGASGALTPVGESANFWGEKGKQVGTGMVAGGAMAPVTAGAARVISPKVREHIATLLKAGVTPTPGKMLGGMARNIEERATSIPILGDLIQSANRKSVDEFNRAAYARALAPIGENAKDLPIGREGIGAVKRELGKAYDDLLPLISFKADPQFSQQIATVQNMARQGLNPEQLGIFEKQLRNMVVSKMTPQGNMNGETLKSVESELGQLIRGYGKDPSFANRQLADAFKEVQSAIRETLVRSNPQLADRLKAVNAGYAIYDRIRGAGSRLGDKTGGFTPSDLAAAVQRGDSSVKKGAYAEGSALLQDLSDAGIATLPNRYPDSGTTGRLLQNLAVGGAAAGTGYLTNPVVPGIAALSTLPYLPGGRQIAAALLAKRPESAQAIAQALRAASPAISGAVAGQVVGH